MFALIAFPWPVPSANVPLISISSRALPQPRQPTRSAVTAGSVPSHGQGGPASEAGQQKSLVAPRV
jgi:hypothetical protein